MVAVILLLCSKTPLKTCNNNRALSQAEVVQNCDLLSFSPLACDTFILWAGLIVIMLLKLSSRQDADDVKEPWCSRLDH